MSKVNYKKIHNSSLNTKQLLSKNKKLCSEILNDITELKLKTMPFVLVIYVIRYFRIKTAY